MKFKEIKNKETYFKKHYPFGDRPKLTDKKRCIHCNREFVVGDYKVQIDCDIEYIVCPSAPACSGTVIDWTDVRKTNKNKITL
jgi:hypothetical protein